MPRGDQLTRQWGVLSLVDVHHYGITIDELAQETGSHTRTVRRDLAALERTGFPLYTEEVDGQVRWKLLTAFKNAPHAPFTITELLSLYLSRDLLKVLKGTPFYESIESLLEKIRKTISPKTLEHLGKLEHSLYAAQRKQKDYGRYKHLLEQLMEATAEGRTVEITYHTMHSDKITVRKIDPYKIWYYENTFFLIGRCHRHNEVRMFVVERIKSLKVLKEGFSVPPDFSIENYVRESFGVMHGDRVTVVVRFDKEVAGYIKEKVWHPSQKIKANRDGSITVTLTVSGTAEVKHWAMSYGRHAQIIKPDSLRDEVKKELAQALKNYAAAAG
jgi:predicted DNA-binding transcriptional regulator YafY